ncbi:MAG: ribosome silencing factor [Cyanobacteriota bacterium]|nr:ribosome silencing factor [Cyanobacteriota bacterium]
MAIADAADDRKAEDIVLLSVEEISYLADYFAIVTGFSKAQVRAISESILDRVETEFGRSCPRIEGQSEGTWILLDYGDAIAHVMMPEEREFYNLEAFWGHAERIEYPASAPNHSD